LRSVQRQAQAKMKMNVSLSISSNHVFGKRCDVDSYAREKHSTIHICECVNVWAMRQVRQHGRHNILWFVLNAYLARTFYVMKSMAYKKFNIMIIIRLGASHAEIARIPPPPPLTMPRQSSGRYHPKGDTCID